VREVRSKIYLLDERDVLCIIEEEHITNDPPNIFAQKIAREGFSTTEVKEGQLDYYPPHRILKVTVLEVVVSKDRA